MDVIEAVGLTKRYADTLAVDAIDFTVRRGATVGLLGGNGAGKTTTIAMLLGLLMPTAGPHPRARPRHGARPVRGAGANELLLALRRPAAAADGGGKSARLRPPLQRRRTSTAASRELADELDLHDLLDRPAGQLSAGQKTRVALAKSLINRPELLLLDEPTASLDPDTGDLVRTWLERYRAESGCTILLASHNMAEVERLCSHVLMMKQGRIVDRGTPADLLARYGRDDLEEVFLDIARDRTAAGGGGAAGDARAVTAAALRRIWGLMYRHLALYRRSWPRLLELAYWPTLQCASGASPPASSPRRLGSRGRRRGRRRCSAASCCGKSRCAARWAWRSRSWRKSGRAISATSSSARCGRGNWSRR